MPFLGERSLTRIGEDLASELCRIRSETEEQVMRSVRQGHAGSEHGELPMRSTAVIGLSERRQTARPAGRDAQTDFRRDGWIGTWEEAWPLWPVRLTDGRWCLGLWTTIPVERRRNGSGWIYRERPETDEDGSHRMW